MAKLICGEIFDATKHVNYNKTIKCETPFTFFIYEEGAEHIKWLPYTGPDSCCGFASVEEAASVRDEIQTASFHDSDMYIVYKINNNSWIVDAVLRKRISAYDYIMGQTDIWGSKQNYTLNFGCNVHGKLYGSFKYNGFKIEAMNFYD